MNSGERYVLCIIEQHRMRATRTRMPRDAGGVLYESTYPYNLDKLYERVKGATRFSIRHQCDGSETGTSRSPPLGSTNHRPPWSQSAFSTARRSRHRRFGSLRTLGATTPTVADGVRHDAVPCDAMAEHRALSRRTRRHRGGRDLPAERLLCPPYRWWCLEDRERPPFLAQHLGRTRWRGHEWLDRCHRSRRVGPERRVRGDRRARGARPVVVVWQRRVQEHRCGKDMEVARARGDEADRAGARASVESRRRLLRRARRPVEGHEGPRHLSLHRWRTDVDADSQGSQRDERRQ